MENKYKPFAHFHLRDASFNDDISMTCVVNTLFETVEEEFSDRLIEELYNIYKNDPVTYDSTDVVAISLPTFKRYILDTLPKWIEEHKEK